MPGERDAELLEHVGRYRLTLRDIVADVLRTRSPGNVLQRLRDEGLLLERAGFPGRRSYYQLTAAGAAGRVPLDRTRPLGDRALAEHLAVLWFCFRSDQRRRRLEDGELRHLFGDDAPAVGSVAYCLDEKNPHARLRRVWRVYTPGPTTTTSKVLRAINLEIDRAREKRAERAAWLEARTYAFAVLTDGTPRREALRAAISASGILERAHVGVFLAASPQMLPRFQREWENTGAAS